MPATAPTNLAARMGRWSASHRKIAIFGWLAFVVTAVVIGASVGQKTIGQQNRNVGQAGRADQTLKKAGFAEAGALTEIVVVQDKNATIADPKFRGAINAVVGAVAPYGATYHNLRSPLIAADRSQVSRDGHTALVEWDMNGTMKSAEKRIDPLTRATARVAQTHPGIYIGEAGAVSSSKALSKMWNEQLGKAGERSLPLTLLVLLVVFGSLVAALLPLTLALSSVIATVGLVEIFSHITPMDESASTVVLLVGLAVGVDYTLFYLKREREERAAGRENGAALRAAAATSGRSVLISGATVTIAMAGMLFSGDKTFESLSIATMTVVIVAMLGSLTVLPALLSKFGDGVEKGRVPLLSRLQRRQGGSRVWARILAPVLRHPVVATLAASGVLLALAIPTLSLHTASDGPRSLPRSVATVAALDRVEAAFPGQESPAIVAVSANTASPQFKAALAKLQTATAAAGHLYGAVEVDRSPRGDVARISIPLAGSGTDATSTNALLTLRNRLLPETIGQIPGASYAVTGETAGSYDWNQMMKGAVPLVFGFVLTFAFLLLLVSFRSIVIATKAVVRRIREAFDRGMSTEDAISHGIKTTAGTVTSAAIVMVGAFAIFATLPILDMKQMGIGLAAAVLIDATIVRGVLLPASMKLLGDWNWYLPSWLGWLPRLERQTAPSRKPVPATA